MVRSATMALPRRIGALGVVVIAAARGTNARPPPGQLGPPVAGDDGALVGTGFDDSASTGWITSRTPIARGSTIELLFAVWDSGDGILDSTVLLDDFTWSTDPQPCVATTPSIH